MIIKFTESHDTSLGISFAKVRDKFVFPRESAIYGKCSKFNLFLGLEGELFFFFFVKLTCNLSAKSC